MCDKVKWNNEYVGRDSSVWSKEHLMKNHHVKRYYKIDMIIQNMRNVTTFSFTFPRYKMQKVSITVVYRWSYLEIMWNRMILKLSFHSIKEFLHTTLEGTCRKHEINLNMKDICIQAEERKHSLQYAMSVILF